jgi:hypothetical protein
MASKKIEFTTLKKLVSGVNLIIFAVFILGGVNAGASFISITWRAAVAILVINVITVIVTRVAARYEEMHSGKS